LASVAPPSSAQTQTQTQTQTGAPNWPSQPVYEPLVEPPQNAFYGELGGSGLLYSVNYEFRFIPELGARVGLTVIPFCIFRCKTYVGGPITMSTFLGEGSHHVELGAGVTAFFVNDNDARWVEGHIGYRYEAVDGGFLFRAMFTPLFRMNKLNDALPWGGLSAGYSW
jgi:hypothetical protein